MSALGKDCTAFFFTCLEKKKILWFLQCKIGGAPTRCLPAVPLLAFVAQTCKQSFRSVYFFGWWVETVRLHLAVLVGYTD